MPDPPDPLDPLDQEEDSGKNRSFCISRVAKIEILILMLRENCFSFCFSCSATLDTLIFVTPLW